MVSFELVNYHDCFTFNVFVQFSRYDGGDKRDRTADPLLAKQVLSQLSYTPASKSHSLTPQTSLKLAALAQAFFPFPQKPLRFAHPLSGGPGTGSPF